ncbi:MBL fold metallo-hydrolase [Nocardioides stalactiti]|uniref:MBL fold metallo-hydrolase n=1 Tax=Nocardioides stalactiti TaxID=2755356 RepID=UPI0016009A26|nr:MBL fold metallo-hydrolase [Nocardioides stalactiti]
MVTAHDITDRVALIELPLPLVGLTSVNCYVVRGADETVLVDPGWSSPDTDRTLCEGLDLLGVDIRSISRILTTHHHWDHYTQGITWQGELGIPVHLGREDADSIHAWRELDGAFPRQVDLLRRAGADLLATEVASIPVEPHEAAMDFDVPAAWIDDAEVIDLGGTTIRAVATPGHTRGHVCFEVTEDHLLLTGDHVLPRITPSIAYEREPDRRSLTSYLSSLRIVTEMPRHQMLPAHGAVGGAAADRAAELIQHHEERLEVIRDLVSRGRSTAQEVAAGMTWTRRERSLHDLETVHQMTAVLEAAAHLTVLADDGALVLAAQDGIDRYAVA